MLFTNDLLKIYLNKFWSEVMNKLDDNKHIIFLCRLQWDNGEFATLGNLQRLNKEDKDYIYDYLLNMISIKSDAYTSNPMMSITISYGIREGLAPFKDIKTDIKYQTYYHYKLPISINPLECGKLIHHFDNHYIIGLDSGNILIMIKNDNIECSLYKKGNLLIKWLDKIVDDLTFTREIGKNQYTYVKNIENNQYDLTLLTVKKSTKFFTKLQKDMNKDEKIVTMDIETMVVNNNHIPFLISIFDGNENKSYYLTDYINVESMIIQAIKDLTIRKYKNYKVYIHNFAKFDAIFLLKYLNNLGIVEPIIHNGKIISIKFTLDNYTIHFRESYQILQASLRKLCKSFSLDNQKGYFPHKFSSENNLNYIGEVPNISYFDNLSIVEYNNYKNNFNNNWNFKLEAIKYCNLDCISLYNIINIFSDIIFNKFNININKYPTSPSISFSLFRTHYLGKNNIIQLSGKVFNEIKKSYTGGAVDMYIPFNNENEIIYGYDVNSLYPYVMKNNPMPIGNMNYFEGNIRKFDPNAFGFFCCNIETPNYLEHPILQTHVKTNDGIRTISALGKYQDMLFSPEMDNAMKYGYKFDILWGYTFSKGFIFNKFISDLYNLRLNYPKDHPMNYIAKLFMNSGYGRFGMDDNFSNIEIISNDSFNKYINKYEDNIIDIIDLGCSKLIFTNSLINEINTALDNGSENHNINIAIASAITSYARIHMTQFKNNPDYKVFYTDTDSIYTNKPLPDNLVSNKELGKLKLEFVANKAIFLAPKVYSLFSTNNELKSKVKGLNSNNINKLNINDFESLLYKDSVLTLNQDKWYKNLDDATISIKNQMYTLKATSNKRQLIYDSNNKLIATKPYIIENDKLIK
jgi:DNA polymerase type B, organellar and viral